MGTCASNDDKKEKKGSGIAGRTVDSRHHHHGREYGFKKAEPMLRQPSAAERLQVARARSGGSADANARLQVAQDRTNAISCRPKSNTERVAVILR